jgi:hypothetical protein
MTNTGFPYFCQMKNNKQGIYFALIFSGVLALSKGLISIEPTSQRNIIKMSVLIGMGLILCLAGYWLNRKNKLARKE